MASAFQRLVGDHIREWLPDARILEDYRPKWLHGLEIDLYLPDFKVAIEVQGAQHYRYTPRFHNSVDDQKAQRRRDKLKRRILRSRGIRLLEVKDFRALKGRVRSYTKRRKMPRESKELQKRRQLWMNARNEGQKLDRRRPHIRTGRPTNSGQNARPRGTQEPRQMQRSGKQNLDTSASGGPLGTIPFNPGTPARALLESFTPPRRGRPSLCE